MPVIRTIRGCISPAPRLQELKGATGLPVGFHMMQNGGDAACARPLPPHYTAYQQPVQYPYYCPMEYATPGDWDAENVPQAE